MQLVYLGISNILCTWGNPALDKQFNPWGTEAAMELLEVDPCYINP